MNTTNGLKVKISQGRMFLNDDITIEFETAELSLPERTEIRTEGKAIKGFTELPVNLTETIEHNGQVFQKVVDVLSSKKANNRTGMSWMTEAHVTAKTSDKTGKKVKLKVEKEKKGPYVKKGPKTKAASGKKVMRKLPFTNHDVMACMLDVLKNMGGKGVHITVILSSVSYKFKEVNILYLKNIIATAKKQGTIVRISQGVYDLPENIKEPEAVAQTTNSAPKAKALKKVGLSSSDEEISSDDFLNLNSKESDTDLPEGHEEFMGEPEKHQAPASGISTENMDFAQIKDFSYSTGSPLRYKDQVKILGPESQTDDDIYSYPEELADQFGIIDRYNEGASAVIVKINRTGREVLMYPHWLKLVERAK